MRNSRLLRVIKSGGPVVLLLGLMACTMPVAAPHEPVALGAPGPQTWIDAPLDGMHLPLAPYEVVFHASDQGAIAQMALQINDQPAALPGLPDAGRNLATMKYIWVPPAPGEYVLRARSQSAGGGWSEDDQVTVYVGDVTSTPRGVITITITPTLTPTGVITVTTTPTLTATPTQVPPAGLAFSPQLSGNEFYYGGCSPASIDFQVTVSGGNVDSVVLFLKLNDQSGSGTSGWISYNSMRSMGGGVYRLTVQAASIEGHEEFSAAWVSYQFVATLRGAVVGRSQPLSDVVMGACGTVPERPAPLPLVNPPPIFVVPSITPQIVK